MPLFKLAKNQGSRCSATDASGDLSDVFTKVRTLSSSIPLDYAFCKNIISYRVIEVWSARTIVVIERNKNDGS
jgi:hypothetical protein